jgi:hypothetical protein
VIQQPSPGPEGRQPNCRSIHNARPDQTVPPLAVRAIVEARHMFPETPPFCRTGCAMPRSSRNKITAIPRPVAGLGVQGTTRRPLVKKPALLQNVPAPYIRGRARCSSHRETGQLASVLRVSFPRTQRRVGRQGRNADTISAGGLRWLAAASTPACLNSGDAPSTSMLGRRAAFPGVRVPGRRQRPFPSASRSGATHSNQE